MKRMTVYLGMALAACLSCFSMAAMAEPIASAYSSARYMLAVSEPQGVSAVRLELTLAQWRSESQASDDSLKSNLRADSNHFIMVSTVPAGIPDWDAGVTV